MRGRVFASAQIAHEIRPPEKKKFPVRVVLLELQSIIYLQVSDSSQQVLVC